MQNKIFQKKINSPIGDLYLTASEHGLTGLYKNEQGVPFLEDSNSMAQKQRVFITQAEKELAEYFAGARTHFDIPLDVKGTPFQQLVWQTLGTIAYGQTISYKQLATMVGNPNASRAVGAANGKNPLWIIIPCHRVIRSHGDLGGYAGGLAAKAYLIKLEKTFSGMSL